MAGNAAVILAGGNSTRMGENKATRLFDGEPLLQRVARRLAPVADELLVIGPETPLVPVSGWRWVGDLVPGAGPLGGLYTALTATTCPRLFLVACDMPLVQPELVRAMLVLAASRDDADVIALRTSQRLEPLHAVYTRRCLPAVEQSLASGDFAMRSLLARLAVSTVASAFVERNDPHGVSALNVNTPEDWQGAVKVAAELETPDSASGGL